MTTAIRSLALDDGHYRIGDPARVAATSRAEGRAVLATASWVDEAAHQSLWRQALPELTTRQ